MTTTEPITVPTIHTSDSRPVRVLTIVNEPKRNAFSGDMAPRLRNCYSKPTPTRPCGAS